MGSDTLRREQILDAAFAVVADRSLVAARMRDIAAAAGVSPPSLHYYFNTKERLAAALLDRLIERFLIAGESGLAPGDAPTALRRLAERQRRLIAGAREQLEVYYDFWVQGTKQPLVRAKIRDVYSVWREEIDGIVAEGVRRGQLRADRAPLAACLLVSLFQGAALQALIAPEEFELDSYFAQVDDFIATFLSAP